MEGARPNREAIEIPAQFRVLIIDDSEANALLVAELLRGRWPELTSQRVDDTATMREVLQNETFNGVVCDITTPGFEAGQALEILEQEELELPIIIVAGFAGFDAVVSLIKRGAQGFVYEDDLARLPLAMERAAAEIGASVPAGRAEHAVEGSERRFTALAEQVPVGIFETDLDLKVTYANQWALDMFGYSAQDVANGLFGLDMLAPESRDRASRKFEARMRGAVSASADYDGLKADGSKFPLQLHVSAVVSDGVAEGVRGVFVDVTERKQVEKRLRQHEIMNSCTDDLLALVDTQYVYVAANAAYLHALGKTREELIGSTVQDMLGAEFFTSLVELHAARTLSGEEIRYQDWVHYPRLGTRFMDISYHPYRGPEGGILGYVATGHDLTERKQQEDALRSSEERFRAINQAASDGIVVTDQAGAITTWNAAATRIFGYSEEEALGKGVHDLIIPEHYRSEYADAVAQLRQSGTGPFIDQITEVSARHKSGREIDVEISVASMILDEGRFALGMVRDNTDRKQMQAEMSKLVQAVEQSPESIIITNLDAEIEYVNDAFVRTSGFSRTEVIGENPRMLQSDRTPQATYEAMWAAITRGDAWQGQLHNRRRDGTEYVEFAQITPIRQPDGAVTHYLAMLEDITEKKRLADELENHRHHLEELVAERTQEVEAARERAEAANVAKSAFLANMSHEIRTPMNAIVGLTHLLQRADPTPDQLDRLTKIDSAAGHLLSLIDDILDLSKIEAGKLLVEESNFNLNALIDQIKSLLREQTREKNLTLVVDQDKLPKWLKGDPTRLRQALLNYVSNAVKFSERGTITLGIRKQEERDGQFLLRFEVTDEGIGIDENKLAGLFEPFKQVDASTTRQYGGTGLGLVITRHLAELMGGEVGAESELGRGSTFWFSARVVRGSGALPIERSPRYSDAEIALRTDCAGLRVLLVEDNEINREVAQELISAVGLSVEAAENGRQAVDMVRSQEYDLILMDVQMPVMDGLEATRLIRAMGATAELPILAMTANVLEEDRRACREAGMNDIIGKPVDPDDLYTTIRTWLPRRAQAQHPPAQSVPGAAEEDAGMLREQLEAIEGIDASLGLRSMRDDVDGYLRLLRQLDTGHGDDMAELAGRLACGAIDDAQRIAHTLKGAAGTLGLTRLQGAASALEAQLRSGSAQLDSDETARLMAAASIEQEYLHEQLARLTHPVAPAQTVEADPAEARRVVERLRVLLQEDDATANVLFADSELLLATVFGGTVRQLGQQIEVFDYPEAMVTLASIATDQVHHET